MTDDATGAKTFDPRGIMLLEEGRCKDCYYFRIQWCDKLVRSARQDWRACVLFQSRSQMSIEAT